MRAQLRAGARPGAGRRESQLARAAVELLVLAVSLAAPDTVLRAFVAPVALDVSYEGDPPAGEEVDLWLARAVASAHGGELGCETEDGLVRVSPSLVRE